MTNTENRTVSEKWPPWLEPLYDAADSKDAAGFTAGFAEDSTLIFGNAPPTSGRTAITESLNGFFSTIETMRHTIKRIWELGPDTAMEATVSYGRLDGTVVDVPAVTTFQRNDSDEIITCQIYCDMAPVYEV